MDDRLGCRAGGLYFKNPIVAGSGPITATLARVKEAERSGVAAVTLKHTMVDDPLSPKPRWYCNRSTIVNLGDPRLSLVQGLDLARSVKEHCDLLVLANMSGRTDDLGSWADAAGQLEQAGVDAIEINFNCPNLGLSKGDGIALGSMISRNPPLVQKITETIKKAVQIPVIPKLGLGATSGDPVELVAACERAGADMITLTATERATPDIDIYNGGRPLIFGTKGRTNFGTYTGGWKHPITCRYLAELVPRTQVAMIGGGGVTSAEDVVKTLMHGAHTTLICYAFMRNGYALARKILDDLDSYLDKTGYERLEDVRGLTLQYITEPRKMEYERVASRVDPERCNGCGICVEIGCCEAIRLEEKKARVDTALCVGCGLCRGLCPRKAITLTAC